MHSSMHDGCNKFISSNNVWHRKCVALNIGGNFESAGHKCDWPRWYGCKLGACILVDSDLRWAILYIVRHLSFRITKHHQSLSRQFCALLRRHCIAGNNFIYKFQLDAWLTLSFRPVSKRCDVFSCIFFHFDFQIQRHFYRRGT